jgi:hypothetical protein
MVRILLAYRNMKAGRPMIEFAKYGGAEGSQTQVEPVPWFMQKRLFDQAAPKSGRAPKATANSAPATGSEADREPVTATTLTLPRPTPARVEPPPVAPPPQTGTVRLPQPSDVDCAADPLTQRLPLPSKEELINVEPILATKPSLVFEREAETVRRIPVAITIKPEPRYSPAFLGIVGGAMIVAIAFAISFAVACIVT